MVRLVLTLSVLFAPGLAVAGDPTPKVVAAWASGPMEIRVAFDRPAPVDLPEKLVGRRIPFGDKIAPGEEAKSSGLTDPADPSRGSLRIAGAKLDDDERTLILATDPHASDTKYVLRVPTEPKPVDVVYALDGVELAWDDGTPDAAPTWRGWWPSLDPKLSRERLAGSQEGVTLRSLLGREGRLTLGTMVKLPAGKFKVGFKASAPFEATVQSESAKSEAGPDGPHGAEVAVESTGEPLYVSLAIGTAPKTPFALESTFRPDAGGAAANLASRPTLLPWAPPRSAPIPSSQPDESLYRGGDAGKGAVVFAGEAAKCANCHKFGGKGGEVGPPLDGLADRDPRWIHRQIAEPSAVIHPEYVPYTVVTKDGRIAVGVVRAEGFDKLKVVDTEAKSVVFDRKEIEEMRPSNTSIMPVGLAGAVGDQGVRDLIAYLTGGKSK